MGKMIPLTPFIWNNIWVKWTVQCNSGLQNNVFSGLPLQDIFLLTMLHLLNFFLNILKSVSLYIPVKCTEREGTRPINRSSVSSLIIITKKGFFFLISILWREIPNKLIRQRIEMGPFLTQWISQCTWLHSEKGMRFTCHFIKLPYSLNWKTNLSSLLYLDAYSENSVSRSSTPTVTFFPVKYTLYTHKTQTLSI